MDLDQENLLPRGEQGPTYSTRYNGFLSSKSYSETLEQTEYKPLSRRKPILDHESIYSDSGHSLIKLTDLLAHCIVALKAAGKEVVKLSLINNEKLQDVGSKGNTLEGVDDIVTGADMKSHGIILRTIKDSYRRLNVISEEDTTTIEDIYIKDNILPIDRVEFAKSLRDNLDEIENEHGDKSPLIAQHDTLVWIDPLDATKEYSDNLTEYVTLMACVVYKSIPIAGIIHKPFTNVTLWSMKNEMIGAYQHSPDLQRILNATKQMSIDQIGENLRVIVSRSHAGSVKDALDSVYKDKVKITNAGGSGYKTIELIRNKQDAYVHITHIKKWDICAPQAMLSSIPGGRMTDLSNKQISFGDAKEKVVTRGLIATLNSGIHNDLVQSLKNLNLNKQL